LTNKRSWSGAELYDFACVYSVASDKMPDKRTVYADRAMDLLAKAVNDGWNDAAHTARDTDLDPLRNREDFKKLLADLEKKSANQSQKKP
jgi:hypothetical protein